MKDGTTRPFLSNKWTNFKRFVAKDSDMVNNPSKGYTNYVNIGIDNNKYADVKLPKYPLPEDIKAWNAGKSKINIINLKGDSLGKQAIPLSHEYGHVLSQRNKISGLLSKGIMKIKRLKDNDLTKSYTPWKDTAMDYLRVPEESNAWRLGIKNLKKLGASSKELQFAKEYKKNALDTYKAGRNFRVADRLYKFVRPNKSSPNPLELMKESERKIRRNWNLQELGDVFE